MRIVFIGAGQLTKIAATELLKEGHDVIIIDIDKNRIDELSEELDCGFIHGDGTKPRILEEADPKHTDMLFCVTGDDRSNIIASLVAKSLNFKKTVLAIQDADFEPISSKLDLESTIVPAKLVSTYLQELIHGRDVFQICNMMQKKVHLFSFCAAKDDEKSIENVKLPDLCKIVWIFRNEDLIFPEKDTEIQEKDCVVIAAHLDKIGHLKEQYKGKEICQNFG